MRAACVLLAGSAAGLDRPHMLQHKYESFSHSERSRQPFHFQHHKSQKVAHEVYGTANKDTYRSPPIHLMNGEAWFTLPTVNRMPFPKPGKPYAIVQFKPNMVDQFGNSPPMSDLYVHHWLIYDKLVGGSGDNLGCGENSFVSNIFGGAAAMRQTCGCDIPDGYGLYSTEGQDYFSANIHIINHVDVSPEHFQEFPDPVAAAHKSCIECNYSPGNTGSGCHKGDMGNFACCQDNDRCLTNHPENTTKTTYYLEYDVTWITEMDQVKPLRYGVIDTFSCHALGNIAPNMHTSTHTCDDNYCVGEIERTVDQTGEIIWMWGHSHIGNINGSVFHNGEHVCDQRAYYGTDPTNPSPTKEHGDNEKGYLNRFDVCIHASGRQGAASKKTLKVKKGDKIKVRNLYSVEKVDKNILPFPGGAHGGVMGLFYFHISVDSYKCEKGQCVPVAEGGVELATCQAAC